MRGFCTVLLLLGTALPGSAPAQAQTGRTPDTVVVATRHQRDLVAAPYSVFFRDEDQIKLRLQARSFPEAIAELPGVMLQSTGHGMSSPHLRGLTGQRVLLLADGIRVNNAVLREGPNQYWNTLSGLFYDNVEVLLGPASVLYGSDAVGGVVLVRSEPLQRGQADAAWQWHGGEGLVRYSSAEDSFSEYLEAKMAFNDKFSFQLGLTNQDFGELDSGGHVRNANTDYQQWGVNTRATWWLGADASVNFGFDYFDQTDVERVHKTTAMQPFHGTTPGSDQRRVFDHQRSAGFVRYERLVAAPWLDQFSVTLSYQQILEDYFADRTTAKDRLEFRTTRDDTYGLDLQLRSNSAWGTWVYGFDYHHDRVDSWGENLKVSSGAVTVQPQGQVATDATYDLLGAYIQNERFWSTRLESITGLRYTSAHLDADGVNVPGSGVESLSGNWGALTASIRWNYHLNLAPAPRRTVLFAGITQGFRAPNLSDASRDDEFGGGTEKPTTDLAEERFVSYETGLKIDDRRLALQLALYRIDIQDRIGRLNIPTTKRNLEEGQINGLELRASYAVTPQWQLFGNLAWQEGSETTYYELDLSRPGASRPMARIMPLTSLAGIRWQQQAGRRYWAELAIEAADQQDKLADVEKNDNRIPAGGTPGYTVVHLRGGCRIGARSDLSVALENLFDKEYRVHGSGINEPGRNLAITLRTRF